MHIITFGTTGYSVRYRDYSIELERIQSQAIKLGCSFEGYTQTSQIILESPLGQNAYPMRKGAGYWSWKPDIILDSIRKHPYELILYLDADFELVDIRPLFRNSPGINQGLSLFKSPHLLNDWISDRCANFFGISSNTNFPMFTAGAILINPQAPTVIRDLVNWQRYLANPRLLLDPIFDFKLKHRHDQSILSAMIAAGLINVAPLPDGIYVEAVSVNVDYEASWLRTKNSQPGKSGISNFIVRIRSLYFHKMELILYWLLKNVGSPKSWMHR